MDATDPPPARRADLRGERCPYTFIKARLAIEEMAEGEILEVVLDFRPAWERVPASMGVLGHELVGEVPGPDAARTFRFRKGPGDGAASDP